MRFPTTESAGIGSIEMVGLLSLAASRILIGAELLALPTTLATSLGADSATAERTAWMARLLGVRDLALGAGAVAGCRSLPATRVSLVTQAVCDGGDLVVLASAGRGRSVSRPRAIAAAGAAGAGLVVDVWLLIRLS